MDRQCVEYECHEEKTCAEGFECDTNNKCRRIEGYCNDTIEELNCGPWRQCNEEHQCEAIPCENHSDCGVWGECIVQTCMQKIIAGNCVNNGCTDADYECISNKCVYKEANGLVFEVKTTDADQVVEFYALRPANEIEGVVADCGEDGEVVELVKCKYANPGMHSMTILGRLNKFRLYNNTTDSIPKDVFSDLKQWGTDNHWTNTSSMFSAAQNFSISDPNPPDLRQVTDMTHMFASTKGFNSPLNHWDVSNVTDMYRMFRDALLFNQPLNDWDVSKVTNMYEMFSGATSFNTPIDGWTLNPSVYVKDMFSNSPMKCSDFTPASTPKKVNKANFGCIE